MGVPCMQMRSSRWFEENHSTSHARLILTQVRSAGGARYVLCSQASIREASRSDMSEVTTDHKTIQHWAERHGGKPAAVASTHEGGDVGIIRIMFPKSPRSEHSNLEEISWEEFFEEFEK